LGQKSAEKGLNQADAHL